MRECNFADFLLLYAIQRWMSSGGRLKGRPEVAESGFFEDETTQKAYDMWINQMEFLKRCDFNLELKICSVMGRGV